ncbi:MAG: hypothetical protein IT430_12825 [Phycisphaerales bacterium]|nr:hypothetical protein [Phycisphaerales bacterium]
MTIVLTVLALLAFAPTQTANAAEPVRLSGVISAVGDHGIALHTDRGDIRIHVTEHTRITLNGEPARLHSLQRGDRAHVLAEWHRTRGGRMLVAIRIEAMRRHR